MRAIKMLNKPIKKVACLSHPITVLFLDDNQGFLDSLEMELGDYGRLVTFTNPQAAQTVLAQSKKDILQNVSKVFNDADLDTLNEKHVDLDISNIHELIYDNSRFNHVAVLGVDYQMPTITGVEFCRSIQEDVNVYKIMLTAEAGKDTAIEAFNEGIIDKFLLKQSEHLCEQIVTAIEELKEKYFHNLTKSLINNLGIGLSNLLKSPEFLKLFNETLQSSHAVEYYLLDTSGSYLFLDESGYPTWLIVRSEEDYQEQIELLEGLGASEQMIADLMSREKILFMLSEEEYEEPVEKWADCMLRAAQLNNHCWYSIIKGKVKPSIKWPNIVSYNQVST